MMILTQEAAAKEQARHDIKMTGRRRMAQAKDFPRTPDPKVKRPNLPHGWALEMLMDLETRVNGRWAWWGRCHWHFDQTGQLPNSPIPEMDWEDTPEPRTMRMLQACMETLEYGGSSGSQNIPYFFDWILYSLGSEWVQALPREPCEGASDRLYQIFALDAMLLYPYDYFGDLLSAYHWGGNNGFYPTPMSVVKMMSHITMGEKTLAQRLLTTYDGCAGTGRLLMIAGDYSVRLYAQDNDGIVLKALMINYYLYVPWGIAPINFPEPEPVIEKIKCWQFDPETGGIKFE